MLPAAAQGQEFARTLPGTQLLQWDEESLPDRMMDGAHRFIERKLNEARKQRSVHWKNHYASAAAYEDSLEPNRARLKTILGMVDTRVPARMERFGDDANPALVAETNQYLVYQVRWAVLDGVDGHGLLVEPRHAAQASVVVLSDAEQTPEQLLGLADGLAPQEQWPRRLAENGFRLVLPVLINRQPLDTTDEAIRRTQQTHREWIYRQAFHMGRHVIGYEVQTALAAVEWLAALREPGKKLGVAGYGEGGFTALLAAALEPRIDAALISGAFHTRDEVWSEPIDRNVWNLFKEFGDAELASLILPRSLVLEYSRPAVFASSKGNLPSPTWNDFAAEVRRIPGQDQILNGRKLADSISWFPQTEGKPLAPGSDEALHALSRALDGGELRSLTDERPRELRQQFRAADRHATYFRQLEKHVQNLIRGSEHVRDRYFLYAAMPELANNAWSTVQELPTHASARFIAAAEKFREQFHAEAMGRFDEPRLPFHARTAKIIETDRWVAYNVVLDVYPELFSWGVLLLPKDIRLGERRPVVVCQHGRNGLPRKTIDEDATGYSNVAARLAERGFITFAPHNLYRGEDRYRWLDRKANNIGATLFSFIIAQHDQILRWLDSLPMVDGDRIAFYGLSYGGETAVRVPPVLPKYCLAICSGDFNQWTRKVAATDQPFSFMRTIEWEMPYWNLGHTFDYAEMAYLMIPRPFMVERGHLDRVGRDQWVAHEYGKVRWLYAQLGLADKTEIEFFQGGHSMRCEGTFRFLHKHLDWPHPATAAP